MIIVLNSKRTILATSIGLCVLGTIFTALKLYYSSKKKKNKSGNKVNKNKSIRTQASQDGLTSSSNKLNRPNSLNYDIASSSSSSSKSVNIKTKKSKSVVSIVDPQSEDVKNIPAEELLELGMNYLNQAIKSWEIALDSIEGAAYMQSQTLALPNNEHADLVFKLRNLLDSVNNINLNCAPKLVKSSQTLQIIQARLAYKQQLYAEALLKNNPYTNPDPNNNNDNNNNNEVKEELAGSLTRSESTIYKSISSPVDSHRRFNYLSDDDNESFVSADSDVDWLTEEILQNIENQNETNVLYEMALSAANLGRIGYRVSRAELLRCKSEQDFAAKLHVIRLGFDKLLQEPSKKQWMIGQGKQLLSGLIKKANKDCTGFFKAFDELVRFVMEENNWKNIKDELETRDVMNLSFYDIVLDFILLDAFDDLESPPSAITAVIQNRWLSQSFKETALATAVWSVLKAKRKMLKYQDGFITRFYSINEHLVPVLAWGFLGTDQDLKDSCNFLKDTIVEYLRCLFDINRTRYTNLDELTADLEEHTNKYINIISDNI